MIKVFRKIRQSLLMENKTSKYLKYAAGEIILVVIGILIALQINNWNEYRKENIKEYKIMVNLKEELNQNLKNLDINIKKIDSSLMAMKTILNLFNKTEKLKYSSYQFDSLLNGSILNPNFYPSSIILNDLKNSGKIANLNSEVFRKSLYEWNASQDRISSSIDLSLKAYDQYLNYLKTISSLRRIDHANAKQNVGQSILLENNFHLLTDLKFENYLDDHYVLMGQRANIYKSARELIENIIHMLELQLND